jgi:cobalt-zinc-cadmium efflux system outer membrane protein
MKWSPRFLLGLVWLSVLFLTACVNPRTDEETHSRQQLSSISRVYRPDGHKPTLPALTGGSAATDFLRFALLNHPQVEAAYYDWKSSVAAIAPARALPDPQLTFQADITTTVMSLMPGLMFDIMAPGKRAAMGREASAASESAYRAYATVVVTTAAELRKAWVELAYVDEAVEIRRQMTGVLDQALSIAQTDYSTGRGMGTLEEQTKILNASAKLKSDVRVLADRQTAIRARFKAALGLSRAEPDPAWPTTPFPSAPLPDEDTLWNQALAANLQLGAMRAMVEMSISQVDVARSARTPDFTAGLMADLKANPLMYRPTATMTLPIWRGKIADAISSAYSRQLAAQARLSAEQISMAAELAQMLFMIREADRMLTYIDEAALPNIANSLSSAEAGYGTGMSGFAPLAELRLMELDMRLERVDVHREREAALADLASFVAADVPPDGLLTRTSTSN